MRRPWSGIGRPAAGAQRDRLAGHPDRPADPRSRRRRGAGRFRERSGLPLAPYFSGPKILAAGSGGRVARARRARRRAVRHHGQLADLEADRPPPHRRHQRRPDHADEPRTLDWDDDAARGDGHPARHAAGDPVVGRGLRHGAAASLAGVPVASALGDQQAALFGQTCFAPGEAKCTYGTGSFLLLNTGAEPVRPQHGLLTTVGYRIGDAPPTYALEGAIAVTGALMQWLRDNLGIIGRAPRSRRWPARSTDNGGCYLVPAFSGLFAPHWRCDARGVHRRPDRLRHRRATWPGPCSRRRRGRPARWSTRWTADSGVDLLDAQGRRRHDRATTC